MHRVIAAVRSPRDGRLVLVPAVTFEDPHLIAAMLLCGSTAVAPLVADASLSPDDILGKIGVWIDYCCLPQAPPPPSPPHPATPPATTSVDSDCPDQTVSRDNGAAAGSAAQPTAPPAESGLTPAEEMLMEESLRELEHLVNSSLFLALRADGDDYDTRAWCAAESAAAVYQIKARDWPMVLRLPPHVDQAAAHHHVQPPHHDEQLSEHPTLPFGEAPPDLGKHGRAQFDKLKDALTQWTTADDVLTAYPQSFAAAFFHYALVKEEPSNPRFVIPRSTSEPTTAFKAAVVEHLKTILAADGVDTVDFAGVLLASLESAGLHCTCGSDRLYVAVNLIRWLRLSFLEALCQEALAETAKHFADGADCVPGEPTYEALRLTQVDDGSGGSSEMWQFPSGKSVPLTITDIKTVGLGRFGMF
eukprot:m.72808 g.72808  ORF g.72808 m.72808 type:complete len:417 (-) comp10161_c0_seq2:48-1298(-)